MQMNQVKKNHLKNQGQKERRSIMRQLKQLNMKQFNTISTRVANLSKNVALSTKVASLSKKVTGLSLKVTGLFLVTLFLTADTLAQTNLCDVSWYNSASITDISNAIRNGANVNQSCSSGSSPLLLALEHGRTDVVLVLIRAGASLDYQNPYSRQTPIQVINDRCDMEQIDRSVCNEVKRDFETKAEAHNNLCDPRWWQSFYQQSESQATSRMRAVMRIPGLDVNYDCGRGDRPLHIALQDSLTPLTRGITWAIGTFMYEDKSVDRFVRNRHGRSLIDLAEVRYDHQIRDNYVNLLQRFCNDQITRQEYNQQYDQIYINELGVYIYIKGYESDQKYQETEVNVSQEIFGTTHTGSKAKKQLCLKYSIEDKTVL